MRIIDTKTEQLVERPTTPDNYAIFSHTWGQDEVTFSDLENNNIRKSTQGYTKLKGAIRLAKQSNQKPPFIWVDNCCIDKASSAELSEAINSMFRWYAGSSTCFVYLSDFSIPSGDRKHPLWFSEMTKRLTKCRWFKRSWTLQELIAPKTVEFYSRDWEFLGTKHDLCDSLTCITGITHGVLTEPGGYKTASVAQKMSWAACREATREEDRSYSLFGIFNVNMAPLYGEGGQRAFRRLQEEIIRTSTDDSIFSFCALDTELQEGLPYPVLATSPDSFSSSGRIVHFDSPWSYSLEHFYTTPWGIQIEAPVIKIDSQNIIIVLSSRSIGDFSGPLGMRVKPFNTPELDTTGFFQRRHQYLEVVQNYSSQSLMDLPKERMRIIQDANGVGGRGRGIGVKNGIPRVWLRALTESLQLLDVWPPQVWRHQQKVFETSIRPPSEPRYRVVILGDLLEPFTKHAVVMIFQAIDPGSEVVIRAYPLPSTASLQSVVDDATRRIIQRESRVTFDHRDLGSSPVASTSSKSGNRGITATIQAEKVLGELVYVLDISAAV